MRKKLFLTLGALASLSTMATAQILHGWNFPEIAGTGIESTVNSGLAASGGNPTFTAPTNQNVGDWATTGSGALRLTGFNSSANTLNQSVVTLSNLNSGMIQVQYNVSWNLPATSGVNRSLYLINRDQGGSNQFRWSINQYSSGTPVFITMDSGSAGISEFNAAADLGTSGSAILRQVFTFGNVDGNNGVTDIDAFISLDGTTFTDLGLNANPFAIENLNDLRIHGKGTFPDPLGSFYFQIDKLTVSAVPEPATFALFLGFLGLGMALWQRRRT